MQMPANCHLAYVIAHEAWYGQIPDVIDGPRLNITASSNGGGVAWEFLVNEVPLGRPEPSIRVAVFDDAFAAFEQIPEFFAALGEKRPKTLADVVDVLDELGAMDETERQRPAHV